MNTPPEYDKKKNAERLREGLKNHIEMVARRGRSKYPVIDSLETLGKLLADPEIVRFPTMLLFSSEKLEEGECARVGRVSDGEEESYCITVHPRFKDREEVAVLLALHTIVKVNYGKIAKESEAELFGSEVLGLSLDEYRQKMDGIRGKVE